MSVPSTAMSPAKSTWPMRPVAECVAEVMRCVGQPLEAVHLPLSSALEHCLAGDVTAPLPVPSFRASIMDGFAVRTADGPGCYPADIIVGATAGGAVSPLVEGHVRYITTGARVPDGADAVVKVEDTQHVQDGGRMMVTIKAASKVGANIRQIGSDTAQGEVVLRAGSRISASEIGILAALGMAQVTVHRRPRIAILSTGDELVDVANASCLDTCRGQVVDCNRPILCALVSETGAEPVDLGIVQDDPGCLRHQLTKALDVADIVVTTGGVSRGSKDYMKPLLEEIGNIHFGEMCMKPGKPTTFATVPPPLSEGMSAFGGLQRPRLVFALPGNPSSCFVTFKLLVVPAAKQLSGEPVVEHVYPRVDVELLQPLTLDPERPEFHRAIARWDSGKIVADSTGFQRSSRVASLVSANCFLELPLGSGAMPKGANVKALMLSGLACNPTKASELRSSTMDSHDQHFSKGATTIEMQVGSQQLTEQASQIGLKEHWKIGLMMVGSDVHTVLSRALEGLRESGIRDADVLKEMVAAEAGEVSRTIRSWSMIRETPSDNLQMAAMSTCCDVILVVGNFGLGQPGVAILNAIKELLDREVPGIVDSVLRSALMCSQFAMLSQLVAGLRNRSLIVVVPSLDVARCLKALWPVLSHAVAQLQDRPPR